MDIALTVVSAKVNPVRRSQEKGCTCVLLYSVTGETWLIDRPNPGCVLSGADIHMGLCHNTPVTCDLCDDSCNSLNVGSDWNVKKTQVIEMFCGNPDSCTHMTGWPLSGLCNDPLLWSCQVQHARLQKNMVAADYRYPIFSNIPTQCHSPGLQPAVKQGLNSFFLKTAGSDTECAALRECGSTHFQISGVACKPAKRHGGSRL